MRLACTVIAVVIISAMTVGAIAQSQNDSPPQPQAASAQNPTSADQRGTEQLPLIVKIAPAQKTEAEAAQEEKDRKEKSELDRRTTDLTGQLAWFTGALFFATLGLVIVTGGLWYMAWRQSSDMKDSIAVAQRAADAAELSAQAAIGVQLPRIIVGSVRMFYAGPPFGQPGDSFKVPIVGGAPPSRFQIEIQLNNVGKTTAFLTAWCLESVVAPRLPQVPEYKIIVSMSASSPIQEDGVIQLQPKNFFAEVNDEQRHAMETLELSHNLWVYGFIRFTDFMEASHEHRFCRRWLKAGTLGGPGGFVSDGTAPPEYTRSN